MKIMPRATQRAPREDVIVEEAHQECRFFVSYSGVKLPFNLVNAIAAEALSNRNTLTGFDKVVYGEVELAHRYEYHDNGALSRAEITMLDEDAVALHFDEAGVQKA